MALIGLIGGVALVTVVAVWATVRLIRLGLAAESSIALEQGLPQVLRYYQLFALLVALYLVGPGIGAWLYDVAATLGGLL